MEERHDALRAVRLMDFSEGDGGVTEEDDEKSVFRFFVFEKQRVRIEGRRKVVVLSSIHSYNTPSASTFFNCGYDHLLLQMNDKEFI